MKKSLKSRLKLIKVATVPESLNTLLKGQLSFLNNHFETIGVSSGGSYLKELSVREGVMVYPIKIHRKISFFRDLVSLLNLYIFFLRERPQIVHSITPKAGLLSMIAAKLAGVPIRMHTFTGLIFPSKQGFMKQILIFMDKLLCFCSTNIYPEGEGVKRDLIINKITSKPLNVIANGNVNGINLDYYNIESLGKESVSNLKRELGFKEDEFVFIFVGRLVKDKGIEELIGAFKQVSCKYTCKLLLVGNFESDDSLNDETLNEIKNNPLIIFTGFQKDVRPYFAISNALVFPSYREGFPNVVMQAGAMELPSIVSNINGCNEIIEDGINGIIIPVKDINSLKMAMIKIMLDSSYYYELKKSTRSMIKERYEQSIVWNEILKEYNFLVNNKINV